MTVASLKDGLSRALCTEFSISLNESVKIDEIEAYYFDYNFSRNCSIRLLFWLWRNVRRYDRVNLTSAFFPGSILACAICRARGVPFSLAPRGEFFPSAQRYKACKKRLFWQFLGRSLYSGASFILVTSPQELDHCRRFFPKSSSFRILPNYVELVPLNLTADDIRKKTGLVFLGRIHPIKALDFLLEAYGRIEQRIAETHPLYIAGDGDADHLAWLKSLAFRSPNAKHIHFLGHLGRKRKNELLTKSRVLVLPSHSENFGNVVPEALMHYTPVIASTGTPWKSLADKNCGHFVSNRPDKLANAITSLLSLPSHQYVEKALNSRRFVQQHLSVEANLGEIESALA